MSQPPGGCIPSSCGCGCSDFRWLISWRREVPRGFEDASSYFTTTGVAALRGLSVHDEVGPAAKCVVGFPFSGNLERLVRGPKVTTVHAKASVALITT